MLTPIVRYEMVHACVQGSGRIHKYIPLIDLGLWIPFRFVPKSIYSVESLLSPCFLIFDFKVCDSRYPFKFGDTACETGADKYAPWRAVRYSTTWRRKLGARVHERWYHHASDMLRYRTVVCLHRG